MALRSPNDIPLSLLLAREDSSKLPLVSRQAARTEARDAWWSNNREALLAAGAAGVHLALFAYNLAFWGFEGRAPDRYWPMEPRVKRGGAPPRYGNLEGARKIFFDYSSSLEGR